MKGLPATGALARQLDPHNTGVGWTYQHELLASIAELIDAGNRLFFAANAKKGTAIPQPIFIPRPSTRFKNRDTSAQSVARKLAALGVPIVRMESEEN